MAKEKYPNGMKAEYSYDALDRLTAIEYRDAAQNVLYSLGYMYDTAGMITSKVIRTGTFTNDNGYGYDGLDRLTAHRIATTNLQSAVSSLQSFSYDLAGNRTQMVTDGATTNYTLGTGDRLASWTGGGLCEYNAAGCVTNLVYPDGRYVWLKWDSQYRLTVAYTNGVLAERYGYDALGRRAWIGNDAATNHLVYDGPHVVADLDDDGDLVRTYAYGPGIDDLLAITLHTGPDAPRTLYPVKDHQNTILALADASGSIVESYDYDAWGNLLAVRDSNDQPIPNRQSAVGNRFTFQGREISWATGLINFRARWYDPETGRWLCSDPIGISGGLNQYTFCGNAPNMFVDPFGLEEEPGATENELVNEARKNIGSTDWSTWKHRDTRFRWGAPKCNGFVYDMIRRAGLPDPAVPIDPKDPSKGVRPPTAGEWGNPTVTIPGWSEPHFNPVPGDVVSDGVHCGIETGQGRISHSTKEEKVVENPWGQGNRGRSPIKQPGGSP